MTSFAWSDTIRHKPGKCACWRQLERTRTARQIQTVR
jgi:hypothetical protein